MPLTGELITKLVNFPNFRFIKLSLYKGKISFYNRSLAKTKKRG